MFCENIVFDGELHADDLTLSQALGTYNLTGTLGADDRNSTAFGEFNIRMWLNDFDEVKESNITEIVNVKRFAVIANVE